MNTRWTDEDISFLKENYLKFNSKYISKKLNKTIASVRHKALRLSLKKVVVRVWTKKETLFLKKNYKKYGAFVIAKKLKRPYKSVVQKVFREKIEPTFYHWVKKDILFLKKNYGRKDLKYLRNKLNRDAGSIRCKAHELGLKTNRSWTNQEKNILKKIYLNKSIGECSKILKRGYGGIQKQALSLGLKKPTTKGSKHHTFTGYKGISGAIYSRYKYHAKKRKIPFRLTKKQMWDSFIAQDKKCALTGEELFFESACCKCDGNASLDRIDSSKAYSVDNIQWVHKAVNQMKWTLSQKLFIEWSKKIAKYNS